MRPSVATALSIAAVLSAGALAAAANLRVFAGPDNALGTATASGAVPAPRSESSAGDGPAEAQLFQVGPAGTVTLGIRGGLHLKTADAAPGWRASLRPGQVGTVVVGFTSARGGDMTATADGVGGRIHVAVTGTTGEAGHPGRPYDEAGAGADDD